MRDTAYIVQFQRHHQRTDNFGRKIDPLVEIADRIEIGPNQIDITGPDSASRLFRIRDFLNREKP